MRAGLMAVSVLVLALSGCIESLVGTCEEGNCPGDRDGQAGEGTSPPPDLRPWPPDLRRPDTGPNCPKGHSVCGNRCCTPDQICLSGVCKDLGPPCSELWPCPTGFYCDKSSGRCYPGAKKCEYRPPVGVFAPKVKWEWTGSPVERYHNQVMMAPMVANLTDDNADGKINRDDVPDIVFITFRGANYNADGVLRVISGDGKGEHFSITASSLRTSPRDQVALGDIDNDGKPEIVACASGSGSVLAFEHDGSLKWRASGVSCKAPALADLDGDGNPEVVSCYAALRGSTGGLYWRARTSCSYTTVADVDEDGKPEVVGGNGVYHHDGKLYWQDTRLPDGYVAVADLSGNGKPEIITASYTDHSLRTHHFNGVPYWGPVDINQGQASPSDPRGGAGGGPPTVADFDGDRRPEIAAAAGYGYVVFEHDGTPKWFQKTQDLSSRQTGSSVFDFEGDGKAEVVYSDELLLRIYQGTDGKVLFSHCNTSGTLFEYPLIVDVDNDGHAEIVVANNNYTKNRCPDSSLSHTGVKVLSDTKFNWVRTRRIWNQHTYHVTNVDEDGRIPKNEARNWDNPNLNNFRQNVQPGGLFDAPDLLGTPGKLLCVGTITAPVTVKNDGAAKVAPGIDVTLFVKDPVKGDLPLKTAQTRTAIYPGQQELLTITVTTPGAYRKKTITLFARVDDDGTGKGKANECKENNNRVPLGSVYCTGIR
jgi:hypothetical protein